MCYPAFRSNVYGNIPIMSSVDILKGTPGRLTAASRHQLAEEATRWEKVVRAVNRVLRPLRERNAHMD
jgi:hypothetical protein